MSNKRYDPGYIQEALKLADEVGVKEAAKQLGIPVNTLSYWRSGRPAREAKKSSSTTKEGAKLREANKRIKDMTEAYDEVAKERDDYKKQCEILKATISFFALDRKD